MKYLQILNAVMLALGASLALCMAVVCLQYLWYLPSEPQLADEMPKLYGVTAVFAAMGGAGLVAFLAHRKRWALRWLAQALPVLPLLGLAMYVARLRG